MELFILYWIAVVGLFIVGIITMIVKASKSEPIKTGLKMVIASVILFVIGAGACALMLSNLGGMH
ncbi:hypothetical protein [Pedobacter rhizosphaerae]|uniref:Uncharacterized protein n=1 Tax=Pedobacter rhizosphaerae TaxID=390241 RepID=A0A1H9QA85_9SPHI|nr:hypothetical protein [Pedobacter rhizosphaerae]SER57322.1 hypothetical protein SAMN04488023_11199 [Pedobacter rhizosphaerae]